MVFFTLISDTALPWGWIASETFFSFSFLSFGESAYTDNTARFLTLLDDMDDVVSVLDSSRSITPGGVLILSISPPTDVLDNHWKFFT